MFFRPSIILALVVSITGSQTIREGKASIPMESKAADKLIKGAHRILNNNQEEENTWMTKFDLKFDSCYSMTQIGDAEGGNDNDEESNLFMQHTVKLKLCPSDSCISGQSKCDGSAEYLVQMAEYVQSYVDFKTEEKEQACETVRENCYCNDNQDDEACATQCYSEKGMDYCIEDENEVEFEIEEYLECSELENNNNNNNNNNNYVQYYVGPYCSSSGKAIHLGVFTDGGCVNRVDSSIFSTNNYGMELPYSEESIVQPDCISCKEVEENENDDNNNNNNYYEEPNVAEICEQMYEESAKCEEDSGDLGPYYKNNGACDYIKNTLPKLAKVYGSGSSASPAVAFAWIFGISTLGLIGLVFYMFKNPAKVALASQGGIMS